MSAIFDREEIKLSLETCGRAELRDVELSAVSHFWLNRKTIAGAALIVAAAITACSLAVFSSGAGPTVELGPPAGTPTAEGLFFDDNNNSTPDLYEIIAKQLTVEPMESAGTSGGQ